MPTICWGSVSRSGLFLLVVVGMCTLLVEPAAGTMKKRVFISTDIAAGLVGGWRAGAADVDDAYAVELLGLFEGVNVKAAAVLRGNDILGPELFASKQIFRRTPGRWKGPILEGAVEALPTPDNVMWVGGADGPQTLTDLCINQGVKRLAKLLRTNKPLTVLAIGPLTDVACLVLNFPELADRISELVFLAGRAPNQPLKLPSSTAEFTDFNIAQDLRATQIVLQNSNIPVTFITFSLSSSTQYTLAQVDFLGSDQCSARAQVLSRASQPRIQFFQDVFSINGLLLFDANAAYYVAQPEMFDCQDGGFVFVQCGIGTPGVYNAPDNACAGHGPNQDSSLNLESQQVWTDASLLGQSRLVRVCTRYRDDAALEEFETGSLDAICEGRRWSDL